MTIHMLEADEMRCASCKKFLLDAQQPIPITSAHERLHYCERCGRLLTADEAAQLLAVGTVA